MKRNKFFSKRRLASFVALVLSVNTLSVTAWAGSFSQLQDLIDANGNVVLGEDYTYDAEQDSNGHTTININKDVNLDLNGWTISGTNSNNNSVITVGENGNLTLQDSRGEADPTHTATTPAPVDTGDDAETPKVGTITGGGNATVGDGVKDRRYGGGVVVNNGGTFTMEGGTITGNHGQWGGGGVYVNGGTFNMNDGTITGNDVHVNGGNQGVYGGGGVLVVNAGKFTMSGGQITGNTNNYGSGGGVYVTGTGSSFTMRNGSITENHANNDGEGGGVYVSGNAEFTMESGEISNNSANSVHGGGGVRVWKGKFTMNGGEISGNTATRKSEAASLAIADTTDIKLNGGKLDNTIVTDNSNGIEQYVDQLHKVEYSENNTVVTILPHDCVFENYIQIKEASCKEAGSETATCSVQGCGKTDTRAIAKLAHTEEVIPGKAATCTETGLTDGKKCSKCGETTVAQTVIPMKDHTEVIDNAVAPTCTETGLTAGKHCSVCNTKLVEQETVAAKGHSWNEGEVTKQPTVDAEGVKTYTCTNDGCTATKTEPIAKLTPQPPVDGGNPGGGGNTDTPENPDTGGNTETPEEPETPVTPETPEEPETPVTPETPETPAEGGTVIPDDETPLAADPTAAPAADADTTVITDEPIPLAGLITRAQLLAELYRYEQRPEVVLPEEFDFAEHEYALAICWGLENALETHSEDDPYLPDDLLTVGVLREVLVNFVAYKGIEDLEFTVEGEDDELVMDLDVRLAAFYELLEAEEA